MMRKLVSELNNRGADFVKIVDISMLPTNQNRGFNVALLIGKVLSPSYIFHLSQENFLDKSEFTEKEKGTDKLAEWAADFIITKGYKAFAQSERNLILNGLYNEITKTTLLPHKTIAIMAGLGWIGKNNLLVTKEYGSAVCMCTILTNAPLPTENGLIVMPKCGSCTVCVNACQEEAIHGATWNIEMNRDLIVDVYHCICCLKCLTKCPWTQEYMKRNLS